MSTSSLPPYSTQVDEVSISVNAPPSVEHKEHIDFIDEDDTQAPTHTKSASLPAAPHGQVAMTYNFRLLFQPEGLLRLLEILLAIIAFGSMSDYPKYSEYGAFKFLVASGVLTFLWILFILVATVINLHAQYPVLNFGEFMMDLIWIFFNFVAFSVAADKCGSYDAVTKETICDEHNKPKAAAAFSFLVAFGLLGSAFFSFKKWRSSR